MEALTILWLEMESLIKSWLESNKRKRRFLVFDFDFKLSEEGPCEEFNNEGQLARFNEWILPAKEFDGLWESLIYESGLKQRLLL